VTSQQDHATAPSSRGSEKMATVRIEQYDLFLRIFRETFTTVAGVPA
jgi:hypothetical protein